MPPYYERERDTETDSDRDCEPVSYATCRVAVREHARKFGTADVLRITFAPCEGLASEVGCFRGCSYGGRNGGHFHSILPEMEEEFGSTNPMRCALSDLPYCACANAPKTFGDGSAPWGSLLAPPPPAQYAEQFHALPSLKAGETMPGGAELTWNADYGQVGALVKRLVNARTLDLALRQSHRNFNCPGNNDGEAFCARNCASEHLTALRAFTVTGAEHAPPPPARPPPYSTPSPPRPPQAPFTECGNSCVLPETSRDDARCLDGGKGAFLPTLCEFGTQCAACGFRTNTRAIAADDSCATARNGVCEDGGYGSAFITDTHSGGITSVCGLGTDATDCASSGVRESQEIGDASFLGASNHTSPAPPPPLPQEPPPPPPPPFGFEGNLETCRARFYPDGTVPGGWRFDCAGTDAEIANKRTTGQCSDTQPSGSVYRCSDGGFDATAVSWSGDYLATDATSTQFGCDYGTSTADCNPRTQDATTDVNCVRNSGETSGSCHDSCWVDTDGNAYHTDEEFDSRTVANGGAVVVDTRCHDGGPNSVSNRCGFGTMSTRCGPARTIAYCTPETIRLGNCAATTVSSRVGIAAQPVGAYSGRRLTGSVEQQAAAWAADIFAAIPPPPPPPPSPFVQTPEAILATSLRDAQRPSPPPPPRSPRPSPPPPPPFPPPPPRLEFDFCTCSCFTEQSNMSRMHLNPHTHTHTHAHARTRSAALSTSPTFFWYRTGTRAPRRRAGARCRCARGPRPSSRVPCSTRRTRCSRAAARSSGRGTSGSTARATACCGTSTRPRTARRRRT